MNLKKIKLINWHIFTNNTIEIDGNFLITGENGCGKSTLTDALYYVLSGGDDKNFNNAANVNAKRTLATYLKGKVGNEGKECLRNSSNIIGHIALEFLGDDKHSMVFGCVIEMVDGAKPAPKFYVVQDYNISDDDYIDGKNIRNFTDLKEHLLAKHFDFSNVGLNGGKNERRNTIARDIFKLDGRDKYIELLKKAIAFKPIDEVSSFVDDFLLKENNIAIDSLMEEIRSYRETKNQLDKEYKKLECLESFVPNAEKYDANSKKLKLFDVLLSYVTTLELSKEIDRLENELLKLDVKINEYKQKINQYDNELNDCSTELVNLENNDSYNALKQKKERLEDLLKDKKRLLSEKDRIEGILAREREIMRRFNLTYRFTDDIRDENFPLFKLHVKELKESIDTLLSDNYSDESKTNYELSAIQKQLSNTKEEFDNIRKGKNTYDSNTTKLLNLLKEKLYLKHKKDIEIKPLCEYLEIVDERWQNAIEGYLNTQRFDIIIDPQYYDDAVELYEQYKKELDIHSVGIVKCEACCPADTDGTTLFDKLEIHNKYAKFAAHMILSKVVCVDNVGELKNHKVAITDTCMVYQNRTARNINPRIYAYPFIGRNSIIKRQEILEDRIADLCCEEKSLTEALSKLRIDIDFLKKSKANQLEDIDNVWGNIAELSTSIDGLTEEIENDSKSEGLLEITTKIERLTKKMRDLQSIKNDTQNSKDDCMAKKGSVTGQLSSKKSHIENARIEYENLVKDTDKVQYEQFIAQYISDNKYDKYQIEADKNSTSNSNNAMRQSIEFGMRRYVTEYATGLSPLIENIVDFIRIYHELKDRDIIDYRDNANAAYERAQDSFKSDFVSKLYERILDAHNEIRKINKILKDTPFGTDEEIYEFTCSASDDDEMKEYYRLIMSGNVLERQTLLDEEFSEHDRDVIRRLFDNIITEEKSAESERKLDRYLDYRQYMKYDIKSTNKYGDVSYFSKTNKEKSGGETQTPFYVIIAACFDRLMRRSDESTCTVIFDEAFNNMDESRIHSLMEFYKKLNIQLAVVVPSNRMSTLASYMDSVIGLIKIKDQVFVEVLNG